MKDTEDVLQLVYQLDLETIKEIEVVVRRKLEHFEQEVIDWRYGKDREDLPVKEFLTEAAFDSLVKSAAHYMEVHKQILAHLESMKPATPSNGG